MPDSEDTPRPRPRPRPSAPAAPVTLTKTPAPDVPQARRPRRFLRVWPVTLSLLAIVLLALNIWFFTIRSSNEDVESARSAAVSSAQSRLPKMLSYSYKTIATFARDAPTNATGKFRTSFAELVKSVIVPAATSNQIQTTASVKAIGVVRAQEDAVVLLALLDQSTTTKTKTAAQLDGSRVQVTMRHTGGQWLVADISPT